MDSLCKRGSGETDLTQGWTQGKWESAETSYEPEE